MLTQNSEADILDAFLANVVRNPDRRFLRIHLKHGVYEYTFAEVRRAAEAYNFAFRARALPPNSVIAIILDHSQDLYAAFLGALMAGHIPTILPYPNPKQNIELYWRSHVKLFALSEIGVVVVFEALTQSFSQMMGGMVRHMFVRERVDSTKRSSEIDRSDVALLQHSSGTTGLKKGVMLGHGAIDRQVRNYASASGLDQDSRIVSWLPLYHDMGLVACFLLPMIIGCEISHLDAFVWSAKPTILLDEIQSFRGEFVWLPNFAFDHIVNCIRPGSVWDLSSVLALVNCSEPCKPLTFRRFLNHPALASLPENALSVCYAMAENVFAVTQTEMRHTVNTLSVNKESLRRGGVIIDASPGEGIEFLSCGRPIKGVTVSLFTPDATAIHDDRVVGEIVITGESLYSGYYKRPEITAQRLVDGWHRTGDLGFFADGELYVTGRIDDLMIVRGKNVYAHEIEEIVNRLDVSLPGRVVAFSVPNVGQGTDDVIVVCETKEGNSTMEARKKLRQAIEVETGVTVAQVRFVDKGSLVKTSSGKISREANRQRFLENVDG